MSRHVEQRQYAYMTMDMWLMTHRLLQSRCYRAKKSQFRKRLAGGKVPQHIYTMESILDKAAQKKDALVKRSVLSQDGIWNLLERNRELTQRHGLGDEEA